MSLPAKRLVMMDDLGEGEADGLTGTEVMLLVEELAGAGVLVG